MACCGVGGHVCSGVNGRTEELLRKRAVIASLLCSVRTYPGKIKANSTSRLPVSLSGWPQESCKLVKAWNVRRNWFDHLSLGVGTRLAACVSRLLIRGTRGPRTYSSLWFAVPQTSRIRARFRWRAGVDRSCWLSGIARLSRSNGGWASWDQGETVRTAHRVRAFGRSLNCRSPQDLRSHRWRLP